MSIVAISETAGSLGNEIGRRLAERLGYRFADREIIAKASERFGENVTDLRHAAEEKPTLWERLTDTQHRYKLFVEAIILEMAGGDNVVLAGLASAIVLRPVSHTLRVRANAPERIRADRVEQQQGLTREAALDYVRQTDHERAARVKFLYNVSVDDPFLYDIVVNTERLTADEGARLLQEAVQQPRFQTSADSQRACRPEHRGGSEGRLHGEPGDRAAPCLRLRQRRLRVSERNRRCGGRAEARPGDRREDARRHRRPERDHRRPAKPLRRAAHVLLSVLGRPSAPIPRPLPAARAPDHRAGAGSEPRGLGRAVAEIGAR
jgi:cytidylate kinase